MIKYFCVFLLSLAPALGFLNSAAADPASPSRCEWTECNRSSSHTSSSSASSTTLPNCSGHDRGQCVEECRNSFGSEYKQCIDHCLETRCLDPKARTEWAAGIHNGGSACLEIESAQCASDCKSSPTKIISRCRRDCLTKRCPEATPVDVAEEALDPGIHSCERCRKKEEAICVRQCRAGVYLGSKAGQSGLIGLGCEKACLASMCAKSCGARLP